MFTTILTLNNLITNKPKSIYQDLGLFVFVQHGLYGILTKKTSKPIDSEERSLPTGIFCILSIKHYIAIMQKTSYVVISPQLFCHLQYKHQQAICSNPLQEYIDH